MSGMTVGLWIFAILLFLLAIRVHVGVGMFLGGAAAFLAMNGGDPSALLFTLNTTAYARLSNYDLAVVPLFMLMGQFGLINTHIAVVLPTVASAFIVFYFRQSTKAFPVELRDAAKVDGLKEWQIFLYIYMPVMRSTYAAAFIIVFMTAWNNYLWPLIVLQSNDTKTITLVISSLGSAYYPDYGAVMIGTVLATIPTLFVFFAMQRQFVEGMLGSVK